MDVGILCQFCFGTHQAERASALQRAQVVERLVNVRCQRDPAWTLELLQRSALTVEQLELVDPGRGHLSAASNMLQLCRLFVQCQATLLPAADFEVPTSPHSHLRWLRVYGLCRATTQSLLRAHADALEEVELRVGTPTTKHQGWPWSCSDLHYMLRDCNLQALRRLVLKRLNCTHTPAACNKQCSVVEMELPKAKVLCSMCDDVEEEDF